jgi:hypothetical protein
LVLKPGLVWYWNLVWFGTGTWFGLVPEPDVVWN